MMDYLDFSFASQLINRRLIRVYLPYNLMVVYTDRLYISKIYKHAIRTVYIPLRDAVIDISEITYDGDGMHDFINICHILTETTDVYRLVIRGMTYPTEHMFADCMLIQSESNLCNISKSNNISLIGYDIYDEFKMIDGSEIQAGPTIESVDTILPIERYKYPTISPHNVHIDEPYIDRSSNVGALVTEKGTIYYLFHQHGVRVIYTPTPADMVERTREGLIYIDTGGKIYVFDKVVYESDMKSSHEQDGPSRIYPGIPTSEEDDSGR